MENQMRKQILLDNKVYEALAVIYSEETEKDYVIFTDLNSDKTKGITLSCAICKEDGDNIIPIKITDDKDKEIATKLIRVVMQEIGELANKK